MQHALCDIFLTDIRMHMSPQISLIIRSRFSDKLVQTQSNRSSNYPHRLDISRDVSINNFTAYATSNQPYHQESVFLFIVDFIE